MYAVYHGPKGLRRIARRVHRSTAVLADGLQELGWNVLNAMVYERAPLLPAQAQVDAIIGADELLSIWTSVSALEYARENMPAEAWEKILTAPALVISARIEHHLQNLGAIRVVRTDGPGNSDLLQSIRGCVPESHANR